MSKKETWVSVETTKRSWSARGDARVTWEPDEEVVSIDVRGSGDDKPDRK